MAELVEEPRHTPIAPVQELVLTQDLLNQAIFSIQEVYRTANKNLELALLDQDIQVIQGELILQVTGSIQEDIALKMKPELVGLVRKFTGATTFSITIKQQEEVPDEKGKDKDPRKVPDGAERVPERESLVASRPKVLGKVAERKAGPVTVR